MKGLGAIYAEALAKQVLIGGSWSLDIYGKAHQHQIFRDNGPFTAERVPVFKFKFCLSPLVLCVSVCMCECVCACACVLGGLLGETLVLGAAGGESSLL